MSYGAAPGCNCTLVYIKEQTWYGRLRGQRGVLSEYPLLLGAVVTFALIVARPALARLAVELGDELSSFVSSATGEPSRPGSAG